MAAAIRVGDIGTIFETTIRDESGSVVSLAEATELRIIFKRPDGVAFSRNATLVTDGSDGKMSYMTASAADLDRPGAWKRQPYVRLPSGAWYGDIDGFNVEGNLE